ncbi:hypothetical protein AVEN_100834-1 [Araneus ventricosus]|uniref:Uncharacterized protein n=1 Tax=Araneus ventricosus TaxID=182803 RepID=A0A4Y2AXZ7_ARAVE|nr:hypothetical protein AVEN_100834-1 [Araneus ventricosus]
MYRSFQNETNPLPKLWIRICDSESESVIPNPRIRSFWSESDPVVPFEDPDPRFRSGVNDSLLIPRHYSYEDSCSHSVVKRVRIHFINMELFHLHCFNPLTPKSIAMPTAIAAATGETRSVVNSTPSADVCKFQTHEVICTIKTLRGVLTERYFYARHVVIRRKARDLFGTSISADL